MGAIQNSINSMIGSVALSIGGSKKIDSDVKKNQADKKNLDADTAAKQAKINAYAKMEKDFEKYGSVQNNTFIPGYDVEKMMKATQSAQKNLEVKKAQKQAFHSLLDLI